MTRTRMRLELAAQPHFQPPSPDAPFQMRSPQPADAPALADLMFAAYQGTIDFGEGTTPDEATTEITHLYAGEYGEFLPQYSFAVWDGAKLAAASLITLYEARPLLAFSMTQPEYKRRGLARMALLHSIVALAQSGAASLDLVVTDGNAPAEALYRQLGFTPL